jgi:hypothetical protein
MKFKYIIPYYKQNKIDIEIELYRLRLIKKLTRKLKKNIKLKLNKINIYKMTPRQERKVGIYLSQLIMNVNTNNSFNKDKITVNDNLLIRVPTFDEVNDFYRDLNYSNNQKDYFKNDEFNIIPSFNKIIKKVNKFHDNINSSNKFSKYINNNKVYFKLNNNIYEKYNKYCNREYDIKLRIYNKLKEKYSGDKELMDKYIFCAILRYKSLNSGANQFVHNLEFKKEMNEKVNCDFECFASMFNHTYKYYGSMFYDIEQYFGSKGSFFGLTMLDGVYFANPPYDTNLLEKMAKHINNNIKPGVIICALCPKWEDFYVEDILGEKSLFKLIIHEEFTDPYTFKSIKIPPYALYLYSYIDYKDIDRYDKINIKHIKYPINDKNNKIYLKDIKKVNKIMNIVNNIYKDILFSVKVY